MKDRGVTVSKISIKFGLLRQLEEEWRYEHGSDGYESNPRLQDLNEEGCLHWY